MNIIVNIILWVTYAISLYFGIFLLLVYLDKKTLLPLSSPIIPLKAYPFVSVLIPAYNEENTILRTLESVQNLDYPKEFLEVIIINDGSKDHTKEIVEAYIKDKPHFHLLSHTNRGKAASLNRALKTLKGEFFACLDADSFVAPDTLKKMLALYEKENDPQLAIVTPAMKVHQPKNLLQRIQWFEYLVIILIARLSSHMDCLYVAPGPFSLYRTAIIRELGSFDEKNITEDQEIAYRIQQHHYRIRQCPEGYVYTTAPKEIKPFYRQRRRWYLGSIICVHQYRELVGNKRYGDFGLMQMVKNLLGFILSVAGMILIVYFFLMPLFNTLKELVLVKFNILPYIEHFTLKFTFLNFLLTDFRRGFVIIFIAAVGGFFFYQAHKNAKEKMLKFGWVPLIPYAFFYYALKGLILLLSLTHFVSKKKIKW